MHRHKPQSTKLIKPSKFLNWCKSLPYLVSVWFWVCVFFSCRCDVLSRITLTCYSRNYLYHRPEVVLRVNMKRTRFRPVGCRNINGDGINRGKKRALFFHYNSLQFCNKIITYLVTLLFVLFLFYLLQRVKIQL